VKSLLRQTSVRRSRSWRTCSGRNRVIYRTHPDRGHGQHRRKGFTEMDQARLLDAAHQQLAGPTVLV